MEAVTIERLQSRPGALYSDNSASFRVWAPDLQSVAVVFVNADGEELRTIPLKRSEDGYFCGNVADVKPGALYFYRRNNEAEKYPDPASHFQPQGVFGPSQIVDHTQFEWSDDVWKGISLLGQVLYEVHIGLFTPEGTWQAAMERLPYFANWV